MSEIPAQYVRYDPDPVPTYGADSRPSLNWRDYVYILLERAWIAVSILVIVMTVSAFQINKKVPMYRASARIQMDVPQAKTVKSDEVVDVNTRDYTFITTQVKILESRTLATKVVERLGLAQNARFLPGASARTDFAGALRSSITVEEVRGTRMVDVVAVHTDAEMAASIATGVAETFLDENLDQRMQASIEALGWLRKQAEEYKENLERSELALQDYKEKTLSSSLVDQQSTIMVKLQEISGALTQAETESLNMQTEWNRIVALQGSGGDLTDIDVIASDATVMATRSEILNMQTEIAVLQGRYKDMHPSLIQAQKQLQELEGKLTKGCATAVQSVESKLAAARAKETTLRQSLAEQQTRAFELERKLMGYHELARNAEADRELYNSVLARMKETAVAGKLEVNNARLVDSATVPKAPFNISRRRDLIQAGVLGACLGIGLCFLAHFADDRIKRSDDMEQSFGLPVLAAVPRITKRTEWDRGQIANTDRQSPASESFRTLRASLSLSPSAKKAHLLLITSANPGAGKSLVSANLAIVFAQNGLRTVLVDCDLRRPSLHRSFQVPQGNGMSHVLAEQVHWSDVLVPSGIENLDVLPVGQIPPNPSELLGSAAMKQVLDELREKYDKVILDSPPVFGLSDPLVLIPQVDGAIFVVRFNKSKRRNVAHAIQKLNTGDTPIIGAVMNNVDIRRPGGYYYYYHQYAYYYDGYGTKKRKQKT